MFNPKEAHNAMQVKRAVFRTFFRKNTPFLKPKKAPLSTTGQSLPTRFWNEIVTSRLSVKTE